MAIKTVAEMFGDDAGNGAAVPYSTTNPPGTAAANRGIQFGEQLTAAIANRTHVALCLNDEDLNARLVYWEVSGLDAAYRLGAMATPGGGRIVTLDGGPVELQKLTVSAQSPLLNASLTLNMNDAAAAGATGLDVYGIQQERPYAGVVSRVTQDLTGIGITDADAGVLNPASAGVALLDLSTGVDAQNSLIVGVDLIELINTAYAGFYSFISVSSDDRLQLRTLTGGTPSFAADTAVAYRIWRNHFKTGSEASAAHVIGGTVIAGARHFDDTPVLTLLAEAQAPLTTSSGGSRYPLEVRQLQTGNSGVSAPRFRIDATGTLRAGSIGTPNEDLQFRPAYYYRSATGLAKNVGFASINTGSSETHGLIAVERRSSLGGHVVTVNGAALTGGSSIKVTPGQLIEIITASHVGVYVVKNCSNPASWVIATLDGASPAFANSSVTIFMLEGIYTGRTASFVNLPAQSTDSSGVTTDAEEDMLSSVHITTPIHGDLAVAANALLLGIAQDTNTAEATYLRCAPPKDEGEDFALMYGGVGWAKEGWQGFRMVATQYQIHPARSITRLLPLNLWNGQQASSDGVASKWSRRQGRWIYDRGAGPTSGSSEDLIICLSDVLPRFATLTEINVRYFADASYVDAMMRLRLSTLDFTADGSFTNVETFFLDAFTSYTTQTYTLAAPAAVNNEGSTKTYLRFDPNAFAVTPCFISIASVSVEYTYKNL